jgi:hypothetical protein
MRVPISHDDGDDGDDAICSGVKLMRFAELGHDTNRITGLLYIIS